MPEQLVLSINWLSIIVIHFVLQPFRSPDNLIGEEGNSESDANADIEGKTRKPRVSNRTGNLSKAQS